MQREAGLIALSANFELYGDMSSRMMTVVAQHAPRQEVYSIDESFLDFDGEYRCPARQIAIYRSTRIENGKKQHRYWSSACPTCPLKSRC